MKRWLSLVTLTAMLVTAAFGCSNGNGGSNGGNGGNGGSGGSGDGGGKPVERLSIGRFDYDGLFTVVPTDNDAQYDGLRKLVEQKDPKSIGINESDAWNHADGLSANEKRRLTEALGPKYAGRMKSAEMLAVGWLETKLPEELDPSIPRDRHAGPPCRRDERSALHPASDSYRRRSSVVGKRGFASSGGTAIVPGVWPRAEKRALRRASAS